MISMKIVELFCSKLFGLPMDRLEEDFEKFLRELFEKFIIQVDLLTGNDWVTAQLKANRSTIEELCESIISALGYYYDGAPHKAYSQFSLEINKFLPWLEEWRNPMNTNEELQYLYRVRLGNLSDYSRRDLFHIPFEKRHLVGPMRYSISGLPSLYLGGSIWICWEELSRPRFEDMQISRYRAVPDKKLHILDFGFPPKCIGEIMKDRLDSLETKCPFSSIVLAYAICWPLLAACSIRVMHKNSSFIPEYIIPQLLLQWIRNESNFDGIRYFSTRIVPIVDDPTPASNYVFPVKLRQSNGVCKDLAEKFLMSRPLPWSIIECCDIESVKPDAGVPEWLLKINSDIEIPYWKTQFFRTEAKINSFTCAKV